MNIYYNKFVNFFKEHNLYDEEMFNYIWKNSILFDYRDDDYRPFIGCNYMIKKGRLNKISLMVPYIDSDLTVLINIHEYVHAIEAYNKIGKKFELNDRVEILPMFYEKLFVMENPTNSLIAYLNRLDSAIDTHSDLKYRLGLKCRDELIKDYNESMNIKKLNRKVKRLAKRATNSSLIS